MSTDGRLDRLLRLFGVPCAALLALAGQLLLSRRGLGLYGGLLPGAGLYAAAAALLVATLARLRGGSPDGPARNGTEAAAAGPIRTLPAGLEWTLVALIVCGGLYLRLCHIDLIPPGLNNDEAINALEVRDIAAGRPFASLTDRGLNRETMFHYLAVFAYRSPGLGLNLLRAMPAVFGLESRLVNDPLMDLVFPLRSVAIGAGALTILALYLFARRHFGMPVALLASLFLAVSPWHLLYSRVGLRAILAPLFAVAAAGLFLTALETGRLRHHLAWGAVAGLGLWTYTSFRAIPLAFGAFLLLRRFVDRRVTGARRPSPRPLLAGAAVATLFLVLLMAWSPVGPDGKPGGFVHRALGFAERGLYATVVTPESSRALNLLSSLTLVNYFPERYAVIQSPRFISDGVSSVYGLVGCEPETIVVAALATLGILCAGWGVLSGVAGRATRSGAAVALAFLCHLSVILTVGLAGPSLTRLIVTLPWICLFAAMFAARLFAAVAAIRRPFTAWAGAAALAGLVALACADGYGRCFLRAGRSAQAMQHFGAAQTIMGMFVRGAVPPDRLTYVLHTLRVDTLRYLMGDRTATHLVSDPRHLDLDSVIRGPRSATFIVENARPFAEALRYLITRYPQGDMTQVADARVDPEAIIFYTFTLWKDESGQPISPPGSPAAPALEWGAPPPGTPPPAAPGSVPPGAR
jgi:hypothetical protein